MIIKEFVKAVAISTVAALAIMAPNLYSQYNRMTEHQREFLVIQSKSLESSLGVCKVIMDTDRPELKEGQDAMRDICNKMTAELITVNQQLENY